MVLVDYPVMLLATAAGMLPIAPALAVRSSTEDRHPFLADADLAVTEAE